MTIVTQPEPGGYLGKSELAARLRVSVRTVERWCKRGSLPFVKIGDSDTATIRFNWEDVKQALRLKHGRNLS